MIQSKKICRHGFNDGKSCLLQLICEYATRNTEKNSLISKVVDIILRSVL